MGVGTGCVRLRSSRRADFGHPLNGVAHLLANQVDTQIPAILSGEVPNDTQVRVGGILVGIAIMFATGLLVAI